MSEMENKTGSTQTPPASAVGRVRRKIKLGSYQIRLPESALLRIAIGMLLVMGGLLWFLPILGLWMLPLGILVLSVDIALIRNHRRKFEVWWFRRNRRQSDSAPPGNDPQP